MKNINEQIERIKQLFTEERLHGNLVEQQTRKEKRQAKKDSRRQEGYKDFGNYKLNKAAYKYKDGSVKLFLHKDATKDVEKLASERDKKIGKSNNEEQEQKIRDKYDKRIAEINDAKNYLYLILTSEENAKNKIEKLIKTYFDKKRPETKLINYKIIQKDFDEEDGEYSYYVELDTVPLKDLTPTPDTEGKPEGGEEEKEVAGATSEPEAKAEPEKKADDGSKSETPKADDGSKSETPKADDGSKSKPEKKADDGSKSETPKTGDFTKPLQRLGGAQEGYTYHLIGPKKAEKRDRNGKVVATYIRESKLNKKALFESVYTFDINNALTENWKWVEGDKTFSDSLSKKFDDAISQIGDGSEVEDPSTAAYNCIDYDAGGVTEVDGKKAFLIKNKAGEEIHFFADGKLSYKKIGEGGKFTTLTGDYDCNEDTFSLSNGEKGKLKEALVKFGNYEGDEQKQGEQPKQGDTREFSFNWNSGSPGKLKIVGNILEDLTGIQKFLDGMVDSLDPTINGADIRDLLNNINSIKDIKLKKRMDYHGVAKKASAPNYCKGSCRHHFFHQIPENEEGSLLSTLLKAYKSDESGDTVSGDIKELLDNKGRYRLLKSEETQKQLQQIFNIVKNY